jgi:protoporphyrin/coproporphyrin ferrochelatase
MRRVLHRQQQQHQLYPNYSLLRCPMGLLFIIILLQLYVHSSVSFLVKTTPNIPFHHSVKQRQQLQKQMNLKMNASFTALTFDTATTLDGNQSQLPIPMQLQQPKVGVLLLNLGGPETGDDVEGFLYNLFADPDIIRLPTFISPLQSVIAWFIARRRAPKSRAAYDSIGGGSPILEYSRNQASLIAQSIYERYNIQVQTYIGMRYWHPFTEEALEMIRKDMIEALVILPLYPQFSISTSGSSLRVLQEEFAKQQSNGLYRNMVHTVVPSWYDRPGYIRAITSLMCKEIDSFTQEQINFALQTTPNEKPIHVLFSAHGVPKSYIDAGDPYQSQIIDCVNAISKALPYTNVEVHLSYQSRVGPIEWLRPYTDDVLPALGERGVKNLVVVPISFVSEHIETLEEIDIEYRELAEESGIVNWKRCPALNTDTTFIADMADMVVEALAEPAQSVTEACVANMVSDLIAESDSINIAGVQGVGGGTDPSIIASSSGGNVLSSSIQRGQQSLERQERMYARIAMTGVVAALCLELIYGQSLATLLVAMKL